MSTLWTPGGEHPVGRDRPAAGAPDPDTADEPFEPELTEAEARAAMAELRDRLAGTPAAVVVANHAYGLFELAAIHVSLQPPQLDEARLAIDALGAVVEGLGPRLGDAYPELNAGLAQLRMAYVQIAAAAEGGDAGGTEAAGPEEAEAGA